ncbi:MAG: heparan-alpha-glucosaminide N-acetyltransferase domain-containing protein [Spirosomaceae bacterium]|nr:heparan-alpha-glucosaminide N-acetyltransferase domain-containing protein [Spirosomataceae bacterium]
MNRLTSIDFLRGFVMVIMALDHTRDLMHVDALTQDPTNLATTTPMLFFTRWITHLCAPTFVFLSGVSAFLSFQNQNNPDESRRFMLKRGLWLIFLEFTVVNFGIWFDVSFGILMSQVIGTIGFGFIVLSLLSRFSPKTIGLIGLTIIFGHNLLANVNFPPGTALHYIWGYLFRLSFWQFPSKFIFFVNYPVIPWLGILLAGFGFGLYLRVPDAQRRKLFLQVGLAALSVFVLLRTFNLYGDTQPWNYAQKHWTYSILSFMNVNKYPPSLLFVCATLGVSLLLLYFFDGKTNRFTQTMRVYGKVPLFYYLIHWYVLHCLLLVLMLFQGFQWSELNFEPFGFGRPKTGGGVGLLGVYVIWLSVVAALYPLCAWYSRYKAAHPEQWWWRYL